MQAHQTKPFAERFSEVKILQKNEKAPYVAELDWSELPKGIVKSKENLLSGYVSENGSYRVTRYEEVRSNKLKIERGIKTVGSALAVGSNTLASGLLAYFGGKLLLNSGGDTEDNYKSIGKGFAVSAAAGIATAFAQENANWGVGAAGMGIFSKFLDKPWGLPLFAIFDGISSIGMGEVRYRQEQNAHSVQRSIFSNPKLYALRFLQPIEQGIISFFKEVRNPMRLFKEEPYSVFQSSGGGLVTAGGLLGIASMFTNKVSEKLKSLPYLFYSMFSTANLIALFRDGQIVNWRAKNFKGNKPGQYYSQLTEGLFKQAAAPLLAINNLLLGLKGLGLETTSNKLYNSAMSFRSIGAGVAMLGFAAQSLLNFFKPMRLGPTRKEIVKLEINPTKAKDALFSLINKLKSEKPTDTYSPLDKETLKLIDESIASDKDAEIFYGIRNLNTFKKQKGFSQTGLPTPSNPYANKRTFLDRETHAWQVLFTGKNIIDTTIEEARKNDDTETLNYLIKHERAFKIACLLHDLGHTARSHVTEKAIVGQNNDEYTKMILMNLGDTDPEVHNFILNNCGEETLNQVLEIISRESPLYKLMKDADRYQYQLLGDFITIENPRLQMPKGSIQDLHDFAQDIRFYKEGEKLKVAYSEEGAIKKLIREYNRLIFDVTFNNNVVAYAESDLMYAIGLSAALTLTKNKQITSANIKHMTQDTVDQLVIEGLESIHKGIFPVEVELICGGEGYSGYDPNDPKNKIMSVTENGIEEIVSYVETVIQTRDPELYNYLKPKIDILTNPREVRLVAEISKEFEFEKQTNAKKPSVQYADAAA